MQYEQRTLQPTYFLQAWEKDKNIYDYILIRNLKKEDYGRKWWIEFCALIPVVRIHILIL